MKTIRLRPGKERSLLRRHPWVFESSVAGGKADSGETVRVEGSDGKFLAWAAYSPNSQIRLRAWSFTEAERIDRAFFERRIAQAIAAGVPTHVHPHMLRHSFASHVLQSSGDLRAVQELLGHANITTTQVYTKLDFGHLSKVYDAAHPRAKKRNPSSP